MEEEIKQRRMHILALIVDDGAICKTLSLLYGHVIVNDCLIRPLVKDLIPVGSDKWLIITVGKSKGINFIDKIALFPVSKPAHDSCLKYKNK